MNIKILGECIKKASLNESIPTADCRSQTYLDQTSLRRKETRVFQCQSDTADSKSYRYSDDNGKTWGDWISLEPKAKKPLPNGDQYEWMPYSSAEHIYNPVYDHYVSVDRLFIFAGGYNSATGKSWDHHERTIVYHSYLIIEDENLNKLNSKLIKYEEGADFDKDTYLTSGFLDRNAGSGTHLTILKNGDIMFNLEVPMEHLCRITGTDVNTFFPTCPHHATGIIIFRGVWNPEEQNYDLTFAEPFMVDDRVSSRCFAESAIAELKSGKILVVFRGDNHVFPQWDSRISPYMPEYKWYSLSDDGGKTFSPPVPWHYETREVVYSSATISHFIRSTKNGKLYWIGNITEPQKTDGNFPRFPLQIAEVDEEWGCLKKDTVTVIDTKREGETNWMQLSNFDLLEDRETGNIEIRLTKLGQYDETKPFYADTWEYTIILPEKE